eukprot:2832452-Prymnesium_polylepis.2
MRPPEGAACCGGRQHAVITLEPQCVSLVNLQVVDQLPVVGPHNLVEHLALLHDCAHEAQHFRARKRCHLARGARMGDRNCSSDDAVPQ